MVDLFKGLIDIPVPFNMIVLVVLIVSAAGAIAGFAKEIRKFFCHRQDIDFKRELVDRGLSCEEIERIVAAPVRDGEGKSMTVNGNCFPGATAQPAKA